MMGMLLVVLIIVAIACYVKRLQKAGQSESDPYADGWLDGKITISKPIQMNGKGDLEAQNGRTDDLEITGVDGQQATSQGVEPTNKTLDDLASKFDDSDEEEAQQPEVRTAQALYDYDADDDDELSFK